MAEFWENKESWLYQFIQNFHAAHELELFKTIGVSLQANDSTDMINQPRCALLLLNKFINGSNNMSY